MAAAAVLRPSTSQVEFTARPALRANGANVTNKGSYGAGGDTKVPSPPANGKNSSGPSSASSMMANPKLSVIEIEALLREKVRAKYSDLQKGFSMYDRDNTSSLTRGEFRRVLESFCMTFTSEQFDNIMHKVDTNPNGTVRYNEFLDKFYGKGQPKPSSTKSVDRWVNKNYNAIPPRPTSPQEMNTDMTEKMIRDKLQGSGNLKNVIKALRLYDYNRDGYIQRHELRKVLENFCFKMTDAQYDKLYQRFDFHHRGVINYKDFLVRLGLNVDKTGKPVENNAAMNWSQQPQQVLPPNKLGLKRPDDNAIRGMDIHHIEVEFRKKMVENYVNLKRMFLSLDKNLDGMIAIEDLVSVLNHFAFAMSPQLFQQLMERFEIKASGKISWEFFLEKFQDPQAHGNGQTVTIKPGHKFFPIRGAEEAMDMAQIIRLLDNHVKNAYSSFKHAFLMIDINRKNKITRKELKKIIEGFKFRMTEGQFSELFSILDPEHTNFITYQEFLELFEPKESITGHKWLNSCHKFNEHQKPTILAWKTVEEIIKDRIEDNWRELSRAIMACDPQADGMIYPAELRRLLEKFCLPVSDNHFESMMKRIPTKDSSGRVSYMQFLGQLNVTISPGDLEGVSTRIQKASDEEVARHNLDQSLMQNQIEDRAHDRTVGMSVDELIIRIKDRIAQHNRELAAAFKVFDRNNKGKISKREFREVCESHGIYMSDPQFKELCGALRFNRGSMQYSDFVANFEDLREGGPSETLNKVSNHRVNPIRGDEYGMSAIEVESKLRNKLRENFEDLRGAFYKFDDHHVGQLTKSAFRRMLDAFMIRMNNEEFDKLCARLGVDSKTKLSYKDFLDKFETKEPIEGHKWLISDHRFNEIQPMGLMKAEDIHEVLSQKAHRQYKDLAAAFRAMDASGTGAISKKDLRGVLYKFMLPTSKQEFNRLWSWYDRGDKGFLTHQDFLRRLTAEEFTPGDQKGQSAVIILTSKANMEDRHADQQETQENLTYHQAIKTSCMTTDQVLQGLKDKIRDHHADFREAFMLYDKKNKGYLSVADIQRVLVDFHYLLDDDQLFDLFDRLGITTKKSKLSYEEFLKAFEEGRKDFYAPKPDDALIPRVENEQLTPEQAEQKMRKQVAAQLEVIQSALQAFDKSNTGFIDVRDFRRLLDNFCFKMSSKQFKHFRGKLGVNRDNSMDYTYFLESFKDADPDTDPRKWLSAIEQRLEDNAPREMGMDEVHAALRELVTARVYSIAQAFASVDYAGLGVVAKQDFHNVMNQHVIRLSEEQFERLWSTLRVNEFGNMEYNDFLEHYTSADPRSFRPPSTPLFPRPPTSMDTGRRLHSSSGRPVTPLVNAQSTEDKVKEKINKHWQEIQKQCRAIDTTNVGQITQEEIKGILGKYNLGLSYDDMFKLILKYDLHNNSRFCYPQFIRNFVLNLGSAPSSSGSARPGSAGTGGRMSKLMEGRLSRQKMTPTRLGQPTSPTHRPAGRSPTLSPELADALSRVAGTVGTHWKELRKDFRSLDALGGASGGIIPRDDFRDALRKHGVNLSEDEFSYICSAYSRGGNGEKVAYNDFIRDFLKGA